MKLYGKTLDLILLYIVFMFKEEMGFFVKGFLSLLRKTHHK